jgi:mRNA interferase MazF
MTSPRRGDIDLVGFDPARSQDSRRRRPALVIQNDIGNRHSAVTIIAAISSRLSPVPYRLEVTVTPTKANGLSVRSAINLGQIRSVDRTRLLKLLGSRDAAAMARVDQAIQISLGLVPL